MKASEVQQGMTIRIRGEEVKITSARKAGHKVVMRGRGRTSGVQFYRVIDASSNVGEQVK